MGVGTRSSASARRRRATTPLAAPLGRPAAARGVRPRRLAGVLRVPRLLADRVVSRPAGHRARPHPPSRRVLAGRLLLRAGAIVLPSILASGLITGCSSFDKTFGQREAIV